MRFVLFAFALCLLSMAAFAQNKQRVRTAIPVSAPWMATAPMGTVRPAMQPLPAFADAKIAKQEVRNAIPGMGAYEEYSSPHSNATVREAMPASDPHKTMK